MSWPPESHAEGTCGGGGAALIFMVNHRFDARSGDAWGRYVAWSGHRHLREVVTTDPMLCAPLIETLTAEDWAHNIHQDYRTHFFGDFSYLLGRAGFDAAHHNLLAVIEEPRRCPALPPGFEFCGYDVIDSDDAISVLLNCGGFPAIFSSNDLNPLGLIDGLGRALEIAAALRRQHGEDAHCEQCHVWGIARYVIGF